MSDEKNKDNKQDNKEDNKKKETFKAVNPSTGEEISNYEYIKDKELEEVVDKAWKAYQTMKHEDYKERVKKLKKVAELLRKDSKKHASLITQQMGKPIKQAQGEIEMCAAQCDYYADNADELLKPQVKKTSAKKSYVHLEPLGIIYQVVPFNFPFLIAFWGVTPSLLLGNSIISRNAKTCPDVGLAIEKLMHEAGFNNGEFTNVFTNHDQTNSLLANSRIRGVTFTGSTSAGAKIAEVAAKNIKPSVMELGGSDPVMILDDAEIDKAVELAVSARLTNGGQVCTAGKRVIVDEKIYDEFLKKLTDRVKNYNVGDPSKEETEMGPLARPQLRETIEDQIKRGLQDGGKLLVGGKKYESGELSKGNFFPPTVVECQEGNTLLTEETFGPVFAVIRAKGDKEILRLANKTEYGLSSSIISSDQQRAEKLALDVEAGSVFINKHWQPDVRMPFGGVKASGIGRECGEFGLDEFANIKTIWIE